MTGKDIFSNKDALNFLLVGVGGQGTILASDVIADLGLELGYDVKKAEVHGMSQRGGSVVSHVRWGQQVFSPTSSKGNVDVLLAFEKLEAARYIEYLNSDGVAFINNHAISPITVSTGKVDYPDDKALETAVKKVAANIFWLDCIQIAESIGNVKTANVVLLGALSSLLAQQQYTWLKVIEKRVPQKLVSINLDAFKAGMDSIDI